MSNTLALLEDIVGLLILDITFPGPLPQPSWQQQSPEPLLKQIDAIRQRLGFGMLCLLSAPCASARAPTWGLAWPGLKCLDLMGVNLGPGGAAALAGANWPVLRELTIGSDGPTDEHTARLRAGFPGAELVLL